jgi:Thermostable hemolysin
LAHSSIVEIGNLVSIGRGASLFLFVALAAFLHRNRFTYAVATATQSLGRSFDAFGFESIELGQASPQVLRQRRGYCSIAREKNARDTIRVARSRWVAMDDPRQAMVNACRRPVRADQSRTKSTTCPPESPYEKITVHNVLSAFLLLAQAICDARLWPVTSQFDRGQDCYRHTFDEPCDACRQRDAIGVKGKR